nr:exosortase/archaeosortase family protein [candidate division Zixibacteria bacterium]
MRNILDLISDWIRDNNYSHGFLIIPLSIYLIFRKKEGISCRPQKGNVGFFPLILGCLGLIAGTAASEFFTIRLSLILIITGLTICRIGLPGFKKIWFAFFMLLFMIPIPAVIYYSATFPMQLFATRTTLSVLNLIGVPAVGAGNIIHLPDYSLEVAEACSGLRSLVTLMALAALYGYLTMRSRLGWLILFLMAIPISIIANIFRLVITAVGAYAISTKFADNFLHELSGVIVFIVALIMIIALGAILQWRKKPSQ